MREKIKKPLDFNFEEAYSYQGKHMYFKILFYTIGVSLAVYYLNDAMIHKLKKRKARHDGLLDEFIEAE